MAGNANCGVSDGMLTRCCPSLQPPSCSCSALDESCIACTISDVVGQQQPQQQQQKQRFSPTLAHVYLQSASALTWYPSSSKNQAARCPRHTTCPV